MKVVRDNALDEKQEINILLVEDNEHDIMLIEDAMTRAIPGSNLSIFRDGQSAIDFFQNYPLQSNSSVELILLDLNIPKVDGYEVLKFLRGSDHFKTVPIIILSGSPDPMDVIRSYQNLASSFVRKPSDFSRLVSLMSDLPNYQNQIMSQASERLVHAAQLPSLPGSEPVPSKISLTTQTGVEYVLIDTIIRVEADRAYCKFHIDGGKVIHVSKSMGSFEPVLEAYKFFKPHKSNLVNGHYISRYVKTDGGYIEMSDGSHVSVAVRRREDLFEFMSQISLA